MRRAAALDSAACAPRSSAPQASSAGTWRHSGRTRARCRAPRRTSPIRSALARALDGAELVVNCAAYVNVDACEGDGARDAWAVNALGAANVARACAAAGATLVHFSTNYVFAGDRGRPVRRGRPALAALDVRHHEAGRRARGPRLQAGDARGAHGGAVRPRREPVKGGNFVERILRAARERGALQVVADQRLTPTFCGDLAAAILEAASRRPRHRPPDERRRLLVARVHRCRSCAWPGSRCRWSRPRRCRGPASPTGRGTACSPGRGPTRSGCTPLRPWQEALEPTTSGRPGWLVD